MYLLVICSVFEPDNALLTPRMGYWELISYLCLMCWIMFELLLDYCTRGFKCLTLLSNNTRIVM